jgi:signal-transduction protein with cAMP-binding, CBS, and nucleotidyltransferase domain
MFIVVLSGTVATSEKSLDMIALVSGLVRWVWVSACLDFCFRFQADYKIYEPGDSFGAELLLNQSQTTVNVHAFAGTELLTVPADEFKDIFKSTRKTVIFNPGRCRAVLAKDPEKRTDADIVDLKTFCKDMPFFSQLPEKQRNQIFQKMALKTYRACDIVFLQGQTGSALYIVLSGSVSGILPT